MFKTPQRNKRNKWNIWRKFSIPASTLFSLRSFWKIFKTFFHYICILWRCTSLKNIKKTQIKNVKKRQGGRDAGVVTSPLPRHIMKTASLWKKKKKLTKWEDRRRRKKIGEKVRLQGRNYGVESIRTKERGRNLLFYMVNKNKRVKRE